MKKVILLLLVIIGTHDLSVAQVGVPRQVYFTTADPSGSCLSAYLPLEYNKNNQKLWACNGTPGTWVQINGSGGGTTTFTTFDVVRTSNTRLTICSNATAAIPCVFSSGDIYVSIPNAVTVDLTSATSTGRIYGYVDSTNTFTVGYNSNITPTCSADCTTLTGITSFPAGSFRLFEWPSTSVTGQWDAAGVNWLSMAHKDVYIAGTGASITEDANGLKTVNVTGSTGGGVTVYSASGLTLTAGTRYVAPAGGSTPSTTEADVNVGSSGTATVTNLQVNISAAVGAGQTAVFTWRKAGADTSVTCTISGASATACSDVSHSFSVAIGDLIDIKIVTTGTVVVTPAVVIMSQFGTTGNNGTVQSGTVGQIAQYAVNGNAISGETLVNLSQGGTNCATPFVILPKTATYTVLKADFTCFTTISVASGTFTLTLPAAANQPTAGTFVKIINYGSGVVTVARQDTNLNGGTTSLTIDAASATAPTSGYIESDGTNYFMYKTAAAGGGSAFDPTDASVIYWREEFQSASVTGNNVWGQLGWSLLDGGVNSSGPMDAATVADSNHLGVYLLQPNSSANSYGAYVLGPYSTFMLRGLDTSTTLNSIFIFKLHLATSEIQARVGFYGSGFAVIPTDGIWVRYSNSTGCATNATDTVLTYEIRKGGTSSTSTTNAVTFTNDHWYAIKIRTVSSGVIGFSVSDNGGAYSTETTLSGANLPTTPLNPFFQVQDCDGSPKQMWVDFSAGKASVSRVP